MEKVINQIKEMKLSLYLLLIIVACSNGTGNDTVCFTYSKVANANAYMIFETIPLSMKVLKTVRIDTNWNVYYDSIEVNREHGIYLKKFTNCPRLYEENEQDTLFYHDKKISITNSYNSSPIFTPLNPLNSICTDILSLSKLSYHTNDYIILTYYTKGILGTRGAYAGILIDIKNGNMISLGNINYFPDEGITDYDLDGNIDILVSSTTLEDLLTDTSKSFQDTMKVYSYIENKFEIIHKDKYLVLERFRYKNKRLVLINKSQWFFPIKADIDTTCIDFEIQR